MNYQGTATIRTADGTEYAAEVDLRVQAEPFGAGVIRSWAGTAVVANFDATQIGNATICLPGGREGNIVIPGAIAGSDAIDITGSGKPPFNA